MPSQTPHTITGGMIPDTTEKTFRWHECKNYRVNNALICTAANDGMVAGKDAVVRARRVESNDEPPLRESATNSKNKLWSAC